MQRIQISAVIFSAAVFSCSEVLAAAPTLTHLFPAGGQRGTKVSVTCAGAFTWPVSVSSPSVDVLVSQESGKLEITIPPDLDTDRIWVRLFNEQGASEAVPFQIGNLKEAVEIEPNNLPRRAQVVSNLNQTINGVILDADVDAFAVTLNAGQTLVANVDANARLGSPMDAILQVVTPDGFVLAENNDEVALDPRIVFTPKKAGTFVMRLFAFPAGQDATIALRGGANYVYRLTLSTGPFITHALPSAVTAGGLGMVDVFGWNIPPGTRLPVVPLGGENPSQDRALESVAELRVHPDSRIGFVNGPHMAGSVRVRIVPFPVVAGISWAKARDPLTIFPPVTTAGRFASAHQIDDYRIPLIVGQTVVITVESRNLESPLIPPEIRLADPEGKIVFDLDPVPQRFLPSVVSHRATVSGDYHLSVRERNLQGHDRFFYRLTARLEEADFELTTSGDSVVVVPEKPTEFPVTIQRRTPADSNLGPISIEAIDLPVGVVASAVISEVSGPTAAKVSLSFSTTGAAFSGKIRVKGTANMPQKLERLARTPAKLGDCFETIWLTAVALPSDQPN